MTAPSPPPDPYPRTNPHPHLLPLFLFSLFPFSILSRSFLRREEQFCRVKSRPTARGERSLQLVDLQAADPWKWRAASAISRHEPQTLNGSQGGWEVWDFYSCTRGTLLSQFILWKSSRKFALKKKKVKVSEFLRWARYNFWQLHW